MITLDQSPLDPAFLQDPYAFYDMARATGPVLYWSDYGMLAAFDHATVHALLRDKRLGREIPDDLRMPVPDHLRDFYAVEQHSMLEHEPPRHTELRGLVLRAFTSRRIAGLQGDIEEICADLIAQFPRDAGFDLIPAYCTEVPVRVIARLLGVPEDMGPDLLRWSGAMVAMYQAGRDRAIEDAANTAAREFSDFLRGYIDARRNDPRDDLITQLIAAEEDGQKLSTESLIGTCVLLLNAGHEATVHSLGNAVHCLLQNTVPAITPQVVEEVLRYDPPLHMFTRYAYEQVQVGDQTLYPGDQVALMLGAAGRDPAVYAAPERFDPDRKPTAHVAFGGGMHFCVGAPLARLEMQVALSALFTACPDLHEAEAPRYADSYHFHKLERLMVRL
ncbi:cytochrome P450 [Pseudosulfitobacter sp. DSM 107133]|uniref:cytochrome P450 n=1 Tax=Pseudosulfitobacter sp. DSM 107133 TaxID=2883100 RepID=UPI000DF1C4F3|nr:cytochrome P450 [Pseudosulfitobacter sp. DSM 107133]